MYRKFVVFSRGELTGRVWFVDSDRTLKDLDSLGPLKGTFEVVTQTKADAFHWSDQTMDRE